MFVLGKSDQSKDELNSAAVPIQLMKCRKDEENFKNRRLKSEAVITAQQRGLSDTAHYVAQCTK